MKTRTRGADGRFIRELPDGTIDAVALGTIATGLVVGAADHLPSANARPADHHTTPDVVPPLPEPAATHADATLHGAAPAPAGGTTSHADGLSVATALAQTLPGEGGSSVAVPTLPSDQAPADPPLPPLHDTLASIADTFSSAMKTLVDHVQANAPEPDHLSSVIQHVGAMADNAVALANEIAAPVLPALSDLPSLTAVPLVLDHVPDVTALSELPAVASVTQTLDHVLNAPLPELPAVSSVTETLDHVLDAPLPELPAVSSVTQTLDHVLNAPLAELPAVSSVTQTLDHVLDATALPELPAVPSVAQTVDHVLDGTALPELPAIPAVSQTLDHVLGAASPPDTPAVHTDLPASVLGAADSAIDHLAAPVVEAPPLQIGFLGQSYTDLHDPHDVGSHGMGSMLHGMV